VLSDTQVRELASVAKAVERTLGRRWTSSGLRRRGILGPAGEADHHADGSPAPVGDRPRLWTRANLKEVFPELPSPLALSYLTFS